MAIAAKDRVYYLRGRGWERGFLYALGHALMDFAGLLALPFFFLLPCSYFPKSGEEGVGWVDSLLDVLLRFFCHASRHGCSIIGASGIRRNDNTIYNF